MQTLPLLPDANGKTLTVVNETSVRGLAMRDLIKTYVNFPNVFYGLRSIGANQDIDFPAMFVEPKSQAAEMHTTAKFRIHITYAIYWYVRESTWEDAVTLSTWVGEMLLKLFSNNALGDLQVAPSNKYFSYAGYWLMLENASLDIVWSENYLAGDAQGARYERAGRLMVRVMDEVLK